MKNEEWNSVQKCQENQEKTQIRNKQKWSMSSEVEFDLHNLYNFWFLNQELQHE